MIKTSVDHHLHTFYCHHARGTMEEYVLAGIDCGLEGIIFLEHMEEGINYFETTWLTEDDFVGYRREGERLRGEYGDRINIGLGVEVGYNPARVEALRERLAREQWDRIGISYHFMEIEGRHYNMLSRKRENTLAFSQAGVGKVLDRYFAGLLAAVHDLPGTALCHLDAVLRHHPDIVFTPEHMAQVDAILLALAKRDMALEINSSGFSHRNEQYPALAIIQRGVELGLRLEAGSDAHRPEDVGRGFSRLSSLPL
ncbi:MAG: histidinol-phosphatase HisJ family protein [Desulfobulbaceae bacterium]|nr:histidinol-phosphatase HisJ family protein [Desulfobulbaceae bacterium]